MNINESLIIKGLRSEVGSTVTSTNTYMLSPAASSTSSWENDGIPSMFILNWEDSPPERSILLTLIFFGCGLMSLKNAVVEPTLLKTVSKERVSVLKLSLSEVSVVKLSFLQDNKLRNINMIRGQYLKGAILA